MRDGAVRVRPIVNVSTADLLGRGHRVVYGDHARDSIRGRRMLVTGAGGSIGSELVRQLHTLEPDSVYLLDHDESAMHALSLEHHPGRYP
jgi:FlaA1/EpsC-like NDP-sugar epimerase